MLVPCGEVNYLALNRQLLMQKALGHKNNNKTTEIDTHLSEKSLHPKRRYDQQ